MKLTWINPAPIIADRGERTSPRASVRLRSLVPGDELTRRGHDVRQFSTSELRSALKHPDFMRRDIFIIGKAFMDLSPLMQAIHAAGPGKIVVEVCDNVFAPPEDGLRPYYEAIFPAADAIVASNSILESILARQVRRDIPTFVIPDGAENEREPARFDPEPDTIRLLWFGYPNNLPTLRHEMARWASLARQLNVQLSIVTAWSDARRRMFAEARAGISIRFVDWSPSAMRDELRFCDIVIVPSDMSASRVIKSANRLITGLWAGRYVVAFPLPSYHPFAPFAGIDTDLVSAIRWALANKGAIAPRIERGQEFIARNFGATAIGDVWEAALTRLI